MRSTLVWTGLTMFLYVHVHWLWRSRHTFQVDVLTVLITEGGSNLLPFAVIISMFWVALEYNRHSYNETVIALLMKRNKEILEALEKKGIATSFSCKTDSMKC